MRIFLDPGHGGGDPGVVHAPITEKDLNLVVARLVRELLTAAGHEVAMSRDSDVAKKLSERGVLSLRFGAELVLSIHTNANESPDPKGLMTFWWPGNERGERVAESIAAACPEPLRRRQIAFAATKEEWPRVRNVLTVHKATAVLVEMGFASNPDDLKLLADPAVQRQIAEAIAYGAGVGRPDLTPIPRSAPESHPSASEPAASATQEEPEAPPEEPQPRRRRRS